jgi:hypothetical protein
MLLRRVMQHVREQDWTAIGIDLVIVVLGVFLGIQVSNWNAERADRQRGAEFAERLRADLREERWVYEFLIAYFSDVRDAADRAAGALEGTAPLSNHDLLVDAYRATQYREGPTRRVTYDELVSTGSLGLIADPRLLRIAAGVYRQRTVENVVGEGRDSSYRRQFRMSIANDVQRELARRCGDREIEYGRYEGMDAVQGYPCTLTLPPGVVDGAADALRSDPDVLRHLRLRIADLETRLADFTGVNREVFAAIEDLQTEAQ